MTTSDFLSRVLAWPEPGAAQPSFINLIWTQPDTRRPGKVFWAGKPVQDLDSFFSLLAWVESRPTTRDIYMCMSSQAKVRFNKNGNAQAERSQQAAVALKAIWLDVDVKPPPKGYPDITAAVTAAMEFGAAVGLPPPSALIGSGGGVHAYWISDKPLARDEWQPYAEGLKALALKHGLRCDAGCTSDAARVLRVPDTKNWKTDPPKPVQAIHLAPREQDYDFGKALAFLRDVAPVVSVASPVSLIDPAIGRGSHYPQWGTESLADGVREELPPIGGEHLEYIFKECGFLRDALITGGKGYDQPLWNLTTLAATFMEKGNEIAHDMSKGHPEYTHQSTEDLWARKMREREQKGLGYPSCGAIRSQGCGACAACPHLAKGKSPLNLAPPAPPAARNAFVPAAATPPWPPNLTADDLELPDGYVLNERSIICKVIEEEGKKGEPPVTFYVPLFQCVIWKQDLLKSQAGGGMLLTFDCSTDQGNYAEVAIQSPLFAKMSLPSDLLERGVAYHPDGKRYLEGFYVSWYAKLQEAKAAQKIAPFGWWYPVEGDSNPHGFAYGGKIFRSDGTIGKSGHANFELTRHYMPVGTVGPWLTAAKSITDQNEPKLDALLAASFAPPLLRFTGEKGLILSLHGTTGTGKSSLSKIIAATYGQPNLTRQTPASTYKSTVEKAAVIRNLPLFWDEIPDTDSMDKVGNVCMEMAQAASADRLDPNAQHKARSDWQTFMILTSNECFYDYLTRRQPNNNAGKMRCFEIEFNRPPYKEDEGTMAYSRMLQNLEHNYGRMGETYAQWLALNWPQAEKLVLSYADAFQAAVHSTMPERNWKSICAVLMAGAHIANILGLNINLQRLFDCLVETYQHLRTLVTEAKTSSEDRENSEEVVNRFLLQFHGRQLWTDTYPHGRGQQGKPINILKAPNDNIPYGVVIQWVTDERLLRLNRKEFEKLLVELSYSPNAVLSGLKRFWGAKLVKQTLGVGTNHVGGQVPLVHIPVPIGSPWEDALFSYGGRPKEATGEAAHAP